MNLKNIAIPRALFEWLYYGGLTLAFAGVLFYPKARQYLLYIGVGHMLILISTAWIVEDSYKSESGRDVQYAGYLHTLIGVFSVLLGFHGKPNVEDLFSTFFQGAGSALTTSILGWSLGRKLENRAHVRFVDPAYAAADDLARALLRLKDNLENSGNHLVDAMDTSVTDIAKFRDSALEANRTLQELSKELRKSSLTMTGSLNAAQSSFDQLKEASQDFGKNISDGVDTLRGGVEELANLGAHTRGVVKQIEGLAQTINESAETVKRATTQSQQVINQVGKFLDTVFKDRGRDDKRS